LTLNDLLLWTYGYPIWCFAVISVGSGLMWMLSDTFLTEEYCLVLGNSIIYQIVFCAYNNTSRRIICKYNRLPKLPEIGPVHRSWKYAVTHDFLKKTKC
jgi:hypothetical protein